ncbi:MAG: type II secretion system protein GspG [Planctomycetota bacterium]
MKLTILLLAILLMPSALSAQGDLAEHLPADSLMYLALPDVPTSLAELEKSAIGKILREPEVRRLWEALVGESNPLLEALSSDMVSSLPWQSMQFGLLYAEIDNGVSGPEGVGLIADLRLTEEGDWDGFFEDLDLFFQEWTGSENFGLKWETQEIASHSVRFLDFMPMHFYRYQPDPHHLVIAMSRRGIEGYFRTEESLASSEDFKRHHAATMQPSDELRFWARTEQLRKALAAPAEVSSEDSFELPWIVSYGTRFDGAVQRSSIQVEMEPKQESWLDGIGRESLSSERLRLVPPDAMAAGLVRIDAQMAWSQWVRVGEYFLQGSSITSQDPELGELEKATGLSLKNDVLEQMNGELLYYLRPPQGAAPVPCLVVGLGARDADRLLSSLKSFIAASGGTSEEPFRELSHGDHKISVLELANPEDSPSVELCLASASGTVWLSMDVPGMRDALTQLAGGERSLWTAESFESAKRSSGLPERVIGVNYLDLPKIIQTFLPAIEEATGDTTALRAMTQHLSPGVVWAIRKENAVLLNTMSSVSEEWWLPALPALASRLVELNRRGGLQVVRRRQTENMILTLDMAVKMHALDNNNRKPETLQDLVKPNEWSETGYLEAEEIPLDAWGNPFVYRPSSSPTGDDYDIISFGADGREGGEDDNADIRLSELRKRR